MTLTPFLIVLPLSYGFLGIPMAILDTCDSQYCGQDVPDMVSMQWESGEWIVTDAQG